MTTFHILTLFPRFFDSPLEISLLGKARAKGIINFQQHNPRDFSQDKHHTVDDTPYGGGPGMVMRPGPITDCLRSVANPGRILLMSPAGRPLDQNLARELSFEENITIICGRYEGIDQRVREIFPVEEISLCDAVLNGGETAALAVIEAVCRFLPGFLGAEESRADESFMNGLLEYPQFTKPENFGGRHVPEILLSGNHARIRDWRRQRALERTLARRPELLSAAPLDSRDVAFLSGVPRDRPGRNLSFCLIHYPVVLENGSIGVSSLTNLDIHDIARISHGYGMGAFFVLTPLLDQRRLLGDILKHWAQVARGRIDRRKALELVRPVADFEELCAAAMDFYGAQPIYVASSARWPKRHGEDLLAFAGIRRLCASTPVVICLGTARGLALDAIGFMDGRLKPLRFLDENHLSVRGAAAIIADRILGDFY